MSKKIINGNCLESTPELCVLNQHNSHDAKRIQILNKTKENIQNISRKWPSCTFLVSWSMWRISDSRIGEAFLKCNMLADVRWAFTYNEIYGVENGNIVDVHQTNIWSEYNEVQPELNTNKTLVIKLKINFIRENSFPNANCSKNSHLVSY